MIPARQTRYWRPTRSPLTRMIQSDAKPNRLTKYRSEPTTTRSNTAPDRASAGTSRSRDEARANNSAADLVTVMVRSLADPDNSSPEAGPRQINHPRRSASGVPVAQGVLRAWHQLPPAALAPPGAGATRTTHRLRPSPGTASSSGPAPGDFDRCERPAAGET